MENKVCTAHVLITEYIFDTMSSAQLLYPLHQYIILYVLSQLFNNIELKVYITKQVNFISRHMST